MSFRLQIVQRWKHQTQKNPSHALNKKCREHVFPGNWVENNDLNFYKSVLNIKYKKHFLNIFNFVWELFKNNNSLNEKPFAGLYKKYRAHVYPGNWVENNGLNFYKSLLNINYNKNLLNIFNFVWEFFL